MNLGMSKLRDPFFRYFFSLENLNIFYFSESWLVERLNPDLNPDTARDRLKK